MHISITPLKGHPLHIFEFDSVECPDFKFAIIFLISPTVLISYEVKIRFLKKNSRRNTLWRQNYVQNFLGHSFSST